MGGKGQTDQQRMGQGYGTAQSLWSPGADINAQGYDLSPSNLTTGFQAGWADMQKQYDQQQQQQQMLMSMFNAPLQQQQGPSYEQQMADQQAEYDRRMAEQAQQQGIADTNSLYGDYLSAAGSAADYVNSEIAQQQANANLLGIDFSIDDVTKQTQINDYFASIWDEGKQANLENLMSQYGNPEGFEGFSVTRGDASKYAKKGEGAETLVSASSGQKPKTLLTDEESTLSQSGTLGV